MKRLARWLWSWMLLLLVVLLPGCSKEPTEPECWMWYYEKADSPERVCLQKRPPKRQLGT